MGARGLLVVVEGDDLAGFVVAVPHGPHSFHDLILTLGSSGSPARANSQGRSTGNSSSSPPSPRSGSRPTTNRGSTAPTRGSGAGSGSSPSPSPSPRANATRIWARGWKQSCPASSAGPSTDAPPGRSRASTRQPQ